MDKATHQQLTQFKAERAQQLIAQRAGHGPHGAGGVRVVRALEMAAERSGSNVQQVSERKQQLLAQAPPLSATALALPAAQLGQQAAKELPKVVKELPKLAPLAAEAAVPLAIGGVAIGGVGAVLHKQLELEMQRQAEQCQRAMPQPPISMSKSQDEPPATDTAEKVKQPEIKVGPDETSLARARPSMPTASQPTVSQPPAPQPGTPQGEPPFDPSNLIGPAAGVGTAILGVIADKVLQPNASRTEPSLPPDPTREPHGNPETIKAKADERERTAKTRQHEAARVLAQAGYDVEQQPQITSTDRTRNPWFRGEKNPDYKIEGEIFDCITPRAGTPARNIATRMQREKIERGQAQRIVLNMDDSTISLDALREQLTKVPNPELARDYYP